MSHMQSCSGGGIDFQKLQNKLMQSFILFGAYIKPVGHKGTVGLFVVGQLCTVNV